MHINKTYGHRITKDSKMFSKVAELFAIIAVRSHYLQIACFVAITGKSCHYLEITRIVVF